MKENSKQKANVTTYRWSYYYDKYKNFIFNKRIIEKINKMDKKILNYEALTDEVVNKIEMWKDYIDKGHFGSAKDIVDTYNLVFDGILIPQNHTSCGSCLRRCCLKMYNALQEYKKLAEELKPKRGRPRKNESMLK